MSASKVISVARVGKNCMRTVLKKSFDFSVSLGVIGLEWIRAMESAHRYVRVAGSESRAVIDIEFSRQTAFEQGLLEGLYEQPPVFR